VTARSPWAGVPLWATEHLVVPAAAVGLLVGLMHHAIAVREAFVAGGSRLRLLSVCLVAAVVLIVRYGRVHRDPSRQLLYVFAVAGMGTIGVLAQPERGGFVPTGVGGPVLLVLFAGAWFLAARLAGTLALRPPAPSPGAAAQRTAQRIAEFQAARREPNLADPLANLAPAGAGRAATPWTPADAPASESGGAAPSGGEPTPGGAAPSRRPAWLDRLWLELTGAHGPQDVSRPARDIARLLAPALLLFVGGGAALSFARPAIAARGQLHMLMALGCAAVLLAAASALGTFRELRERGGAVSLAVVPARVALGGALAAVVLLGTLGLPTMRWAGTDAIEQVQSEGAGDRASSDPDARAAEGRGSKGEPQAKRAPAIGALGSLAGLLKILAFALGGLMVLVGLAAAAAGLRPRLRSPNPSATPPARPRPSIARLAGLADDQIVPAAYALFLDAADVAGHPKAPRTTPRQFLAQLRGSPLPSDAAAELTTLLERAVYEQAPQATDPAAARAALARILRS